MRLKLYLFCVRLIQVTLSRNQKPLNYEIETKYDCHFFVGWVRRNQKPLNYEIETNATERRNLTGAFHQK